ncbi:hypothetical protein [Propionicimonas sp.]|uniref:hypothetical protein n=1 Tax=Propionicimonas sp. TaxID=1955623 RepID=UPI0017CC1684|nr:hypothetical protein [Propionicimonas sp.]MBU3977496.1 hypothetical protein [Actinomycetota bacterium]MBA3021421.1 hypothetical protein [Propionicimonas sp.]MBU3986006.1 hypothetical protein [Actinomycetota bacterium]MBU4008791.1 hypothetical protein [Actinomycetota bacterium]MBU4066059.1 hypothetical protein [Actinomycetota bacterium]
MDKATAQKTLAPLVREIGYRMRTTAPQSGMSMPPWAGEMCTRVAVALGDESIVLVTGTLDAELSGFLAVFTPTRLIKATTFSASGLVEIAVKAIGRRDLKSVSVQGGTDIFSSKMGLEWPGPITVSATYPDDELSLSSDGFGEGSVAEREFLAFIPSLLEDLARD